MKLLRSERTSTLGLGKFSNCGLCSVVRVWFFLKNCCNRRSKRIELYDLTVIAAGVQANEFVIAPFAQR